MRAGNQKPIHALGAGAFLQFTKGQRGEEQGSGRFLKGEKHSEEISDRNVCIPTALRANVSFSLCKQMHFTHSD